MFDSNSLANWKRQTKEKETEKKKEPYIISSDTYTPHLSFTAYPN
jgi:hypothetical protein